MVYSGPDVDGSLLELKLWLSAVKRGRIPNRELLIPTKHWMWGPALPLQICPSCIAEVTPLQAAQITPQSLMKE